jgi:hypothetical protein
MVNKLPPKKGPNMATVPKPRMGEKSAKQELLDAFGELIDQAEQTMTVREFDRAAKRSNEALDRALDRRKRRSETA